MENPPDEVEYTGSSYYKIPDYLITNNINNIGIYLRLNDMT